MSGNCYKVRLMLAHLGLACERREVDVVEPSRAHGAAGRSEPGPARSDARARRRPPAGESNAIIWYLAEGTRYLPEDRYERAQVMQWLCFEQYSHEPNIAVARFLVAVSGRPVPAQRLAELRVAGYAALDAMERHLAGREFLIGGRYTIADVALYAYTHVAPEGGFDLGGYPALARWLDRVADQPGHIPITA